MKQPAGRSSKRQKAAETSVRFAHAGVEYWMVSRDVSPSETASVLTPAEEHVYALLRTGLTYEQIAASRGSSRHTVAKQVTSILRKLKVASHRELELLR